MGFLLLLIVLVLAGLLWSKIQDLGTQIDHLRERLQMAEVQMRLLLNKEGPTAMETPAKTPPPVLQTPPSAPQPAVVPPAAPPPLPKPVPAAIQLPQPRVTASLPRLEAPSIDWEKFTGVKLFAWLGGFAIFLGMAFFVKYSIDHNLISPLMRVCIGFLVGIGAIIGGLSIRNKVYGITQQTLCAAGVAVLYADIFACRSFYNFLSPEAAFGLMAIVTVVSFLLAVRLDSRYVAVLGLLGGFLTPPLMSTGVDRPLALFAYIAMLDVGVVAVALRKRWGFLMTLAGLATLIMELGWTGRFFAVPKAELAIGIYLFFALFFLGARELAAMRDVKDEAFHGPASWMALLSMGFVAYLMTFPTLAARPGLVLIPLLLLSVQLAYLAIERSEARLFYGFGGVAAFVLLMIWTTSSLKAGLLSWALGIYLAFAVVHCGLPMALRRLRPSATPLMWGFAAPFLMLILIFCAMVFCDLLSFFMWPVVLMLGMLAVAVSWLAGSVLAAIGALALIMASLGVWIFRLPDVAGLPNVLVLVAIFAAAFFAWGLVVTRRSSLFASNAGWSLAKSIDTNDAALMPAFSALLPFALIAMVCLKLRLASPTEPFLLMLLMDLLLLALAAYRRIELVSGVALLATVGVEYVYHMAAKAPAPVGWTLFFYGFFLSFPFVFRRRLQTAAPWITSALSGLLHFGLLYNVWATTLGKAHIGALPALLAIPSLGALYALLSTLDARDARRTRLLAWYGGVALFFITVVIPLQFSNEWITLGWALEGVALLWLYRRVPHEGLRGVAVALLGTAFARLALNPAVFSYHARTATPIFNWYLFVYGTAAACFFICAVLAKPPRDRFMGMSLPGRFTALGTVLLFLLLNIQIADYFSTGGTITFDFSGNLARDMTYSLAWGLFAITMLVIGIRRSNRGARNASIALLGVTVAKVFLHDVWQLNQLYRVASIVGLGVVLLVVSVLYQQFAAKDAPNVGRS